MSSQDKQFESLVKSFYKPLYRYAYWLAKDPAIAEDILQETFARAWKNLHQLKDLNSAKSWLYTILSRENARRFERKQLPMSDFTEDWQFEQIAAQKDDIQTLNLRRAIFSLPENLREPLSLQVIAGFSTEEIAEVLSLNSNTVSTRLFRARVALKKLFESDSRGKING